MRAVYTVGFGKVSKMCRLTPQRGQIGHSAILSVTLVVKMIPI